MLSKERHQTATGPDRGARNGERSRGGCYGRKGERRKDNPYGGKGTKDRAIISEVTRKKQMTLTMLIAFTPKREANIRSRREYRLTSIKLGATSPP
jgi:hypothetical protein